MPGDVVAGRYELLEEIGRGGMAVVYRARDGVLHREVALKVLQPGRAGDASFVRRFEREARAVAALNHPNVVAVHDTGEDDGTYYLVMELVRGPTLADLLEEEGPLAAVRAVGIAHGVCMGLAAAHRKGIVHRDVKPSNVVFDAESDTVKVADFGLARSATEATVSTTVYGSAPYMAPEQARGGAVDPRTDVYAMGCVLFEMLTGQPPFTGDSPLAVVAQHQSQDPPSMSEQRDVPTDLGALVARCLEKDPADRFADADALGSALAPFAELGPQAQPPSATQVLGGAALVGGTRRLAEGEPRDPASSTDGVEAQDARTGSSGGHGAGPRLRQVALLGLVGLVAIALLVWALADEGGLPLADGGGVVNGAPDDAEEPVAPEDGTDGGQGEGAAVEDREVDELAASFVRSVLAAERDGDIDESAADDLADRGEEMIKQYREGSLRDVRDEVQDARRDLDKALEKGEISAGAAEELGELLDAIADQLGVPRASTRSGPPSPRP